MASTGRKCKMFEECHAPAVIKIRHTGIAYCKMHFIKNLEDRVERTVQRYHMITSKQAHERWVIAMSGGKDSQALAEVLRKRFPGGPDCPVELIGLYIDIHVMGNGYTDESRKCVEETCKRLGIECHVVDIQERYGITMDQLHVVSQCRKGGHRTECSACGIVKRYLINRASAELKADKVATGHHLTDEATNMLGNFLRMNIEQMSRPQPWEKRATVKPNDPNAPQLETIAQMSAGCGNGDVGVLVPRVKPFLEITEEETTMYVHYANIPHVKTECPYSSGASSSALKKHMLAIEKEHPGTMLSLLRGYHRLMLPILTSASFASINKEKATTSASALPIQPDVDDEVLPEEQLLPQPPPIDPTIIASCPIVTAINSTTPAPSNNDEEQQQMGNGVVLTACKNCGCPTIVPVCAWCKLVEQAKLFKKDNPRLFEEGGQKSHRCQICCPGMLNKPTKQQQEELNADIEDATLTTDINAKSKKRARREMLNKQRNHSSSSSNAPAVSTSTTTPMETTPAQKVSEESKTPQTKDS